MFSAFTNTFHKSDKSLSEKGLEGVLHYADKSSRDISQFAENNRVSANSLMTYGALLGDDFNDVTNKLGNMLIQWSNIMMEFSDSIDQYRDMLRVIPMKEASLQPSREQKRKIKEKMDQLQGSLSSMDKFNNLQDQLKQLEKVTELDEIEMDNFKRINTSKAINTLLDGMSTMANKTSIISTSSKYIVNELHIIPLKPGLERPIYKSEDKTKKILDDVKKSINNWDKNNILLNNSNNISVSKKQLPPVPTTSTTSKTISMNSDKSDTIVLPPRHISLEEQHKQYSFYKPDEISDEILDNKDDDDEAEDTSTLCQTNLTQSCTNTTKSPLQNNNNNEAGFSNIYLNQQYKEQENYIPNIEYEELASSYNSEAVFRGNNNNNNNNEDNKIKRNDAGGFVLPSFNPNFIYPSKSTQSTKSE